MYRLRALLRNLLRRDAVERELDDELRATFDILVAEKIRGGMSPDAARRAARLELGGIESVKDQVRVVRSGMLVETWLQDLRYAWRLLWRDRFTLTAVLSLAAASARRRRCSRWPTACCFDRLWPDLAACCLPARRATRIGAVDALRYE